MLRYMRFLAALFALASMRCAPAVPCSPGNEDPDESGPTTLPSPGPGGPTDPGIDPGESDGDAFGYRRQADGDLCACDGLEHEEGGCSQEPPEACGQGVPRDVTTGECVPTDYFGNKKDPPPPKDDDDDEGPPSANWQCEGQGKCVKGDVEWEIFASAWGDTRKDAEDLTAAKIAAKCRSVTNSTGKTHIVKMDCGRL